MGRDRCRPWRVGVALSPLPLDARSLPPTLAGKLRGDTRRLRLPEVEVFWERALQYPVLWSRVVFARSLGGALGGGMYSLLGTRSTDLDLDERPSRDEPLDEQDERRDEA